MGVRNYLIEGVSASGKTTVADELQRRGYHVIHADRTLAILGDPETGEPLACPADESLEDRANWLHRQWIWPVDAVRSIITNRSHPITFFCGGSRNLPKFLHLFDEVFVLEVDADTLSRRLAGRPEDEFGGRAVERALVARLHASKEDVPKDAIPVDAAAPIDTVVGTILSKCGLPA